MKQISLLLLIFILASCGTFNNKIGQLRLVKVADQEVAVIEKTSSTKNTEINHVDSINEIQLSENNSRTEADKNELLSLPESAKNSVLIDQNIADTIQNEDDDEIVKQAVHAEKDASVSMGLFIGSSITSLIPFLFIISTITLIIGLIFYSRANSSQYITPFGEKRLKTSKTLLIITISVLTLWLLLAVVMLVLFI